MPLRTQIYNLPCYPRKIGFRSLRISKSTDAQILYIKWHSTVGSPWVLPSDAEIDLLLVEPMDAEGRPHISIPTSPPIFKTSPLGCF